MKEYFEPKYVEELFDDMSSSYAKVNYITSFGFSERWRSQFVKEFDVQKGEIVVDFMTGMGECWKHVLRKPNNAKLIAIDFSGEMIKYATLRKEQFEGYEIEIIKEDVLTNSLKNESVEYVISGFGLKTFNASQLSKFAKEIERILKPGGKFSLIDVSIPKNKVLRFFYMFYLKKIIPIMGRLFLGNPETYKMLGIYTEMFENSKEVERIFKQQQFDVKYQEYFFGCASGIKGEKLKL